MCSEGDGGRSGTAAQEPVEVREWMNDWIDIGSCEATISVPLCAALVDRLDVFFHVLMHSCRSRELTREQ